MHLFFTLVASSGLMQSTSAVVPLPNSACDAPLLQFSKETTSSPIFSGSIKSF